MVTVIFPSPSPFFLALYSHQVAKPWIATFCIERVYELFCHPHHEPRLYQGVACTRIKGLTPEMQTL